MSFWLQKSIHIFPKLLPNSTQLIIFFLIELVLETPLALTATRTQLNVKCCPCHKAIEKFLHKFSTLLEPLGSKMGNYMSYNRLLSFFEKNHILGLCESLHQRINYEIRDLNYRWVLVLGWAYPKNPLIL